MSDTTAPPGPHKYGSLVAALKPIREAAGLKQTDLARKLGWADGSHVSNVERGNRGTTVDLIERWVHECGHDIYIIPRVGPHLDSDPGRSREEDAAARAAPA